MSIWRPLFPARAALAASLLVLCTMGCAAPRGEPFREQVAPPGRGLVYIYRESRLDWRGYGFNVLADGVLVGTLANGTYLTHVTEPGRLTLRVEGEDSLTRLLSREPEVTLDVAPGDRLFVALDVRGFPMLTLQPTAREIALPQVSGLRSVGPGPPAEASALAAGKPGPTGREGTTRPMSSIEGLAPREPTEWSTGAKPGVGQEYRTALVVGNASYDVGSLANPLNDATDVASALRSLGFDVTLLTDATRQEIEDAVGAMRERLSGGGAGVFFFAGHGVQVEGQNFLIPVGGRFERDVDVKYGAVPASWVLETLERAGNRVNVLILDACRNNPLLSASRSASRGLAVMQSARGALVAYATAPGRTAADGDGRNSPYTRHLLREMRTPDLPIELVLKRVGAGVQRDTAGKQIPWVSSSLTDEFFFVRSEGPLSDPGRSTGRSPDADD